MKREMEKLLIEMSAEKLPQRAYKKAEEIINLMRQSKSYSVDNMIQKYLEIPTTKWRAVLLACFADYDVKLKYITLRKTILNLVHSGDPDLAQSAVFALISGGKRAQSELLEILKNNRLFPRIIPHKEKILKIIQEDKFKLGDQLRSLRKQLLDSGIQTLNWDEVRQELYERRCGIKKKCCSNKCTNEAVYAILLEKNSAEMTDYSCQKHLPEFVQYWTDIGLCHIWRIY